MHGNILSPWTTVRLLDPPSIITIPYKAMKQTRTPYPLGTFNPSHSLHSMCNRPDPSHFHTLCRRCTDPSHSHIRYAQRDQISSQTNSQGLLQFLLITCQMVQFSCCAVQVTQRIVLLSAVQQTTGCGDRSAPYNNICRLSRGCLYVFGHYSSTLAVYKCPV